ncbi:hypothetical protein MMC31_003720 [Peltigera leucophlebia]|nr:hypothetical protein [Peltigera leucophlebia]
MSEDQDLLARIGQLAGNFPGCVKSSTQLTVQGHINLHKTQAPVHPVGPVRGYSVTTQYSAPPTTPIPRFGARKSVRHAPYTRTHPGVTKPKAHRNRTLVLHKTTNTSLALHESGGTPVTAIANSMIPNEKHNKQALANHGTSWVAKNDRHMQLINSSIFDKETQLRSRAMDETRRQKTLQQSQMEKQKIEKHLRALNYPRYQASSAHHSGATTPMYRILIKGLSFYVMDGGSKLQRSRSKDFAASSWLSLPHLHDLDPEESMRPSPKTAVIGGVTFFRSRNGNLYRSGLVKANRAGQIRKHAAKSTDNLNSGSIDFGDVDNNSDLVSEEEDFNESESDDIDSDGLEDDSIRISPDSSSETLSQQHDFVHF